MRKRYNYEKTKEILKDYHLNSLVKYHKLTKEDDRLPEDPEEAFRGKWRGWFDYFGLDKNLYYDKDQCHKRIKKLIKKYPELIDERYDITRALHKKDKKIPLPFLFVELYKIENVVEMLGYTPWHIPEREPFSYL
jgi:hypothetical protein